MYVQGAPKFLQLNKKKTTRLMKMKFISIKLDKKDFF